MKKLFIFLFLAGVIGAGGAYAYDYTLDAALFGNFGYSATGERYYITPTAGGLVLLPTTGCMVINLDGGHPSFSVQVNVYNSTADGSTWTTQSVGTLGPCGRCNKTMSFCTNTGLLTMTASEAAIYPGTSTITITELSETGIRNLTVGGNYTIRIPCWGGSGADNTISYDGFILSSGACATTYTNHTFTLPGGYESGRTFFTMRSSRSTSNVSYVDYILNINPCPTMSILSSSPNPDKSYYLNSTGTTTLRFIAKDPASDAYVRWTDNGAIVKEGAYSSSTNWEYTVDSSTKTPGRHIYMMELSSASCAQTLYVLWTIHCNAAIIIEGTITDQSGKPIQTSSFTYKNKATGLVYRSISGADGVFRMEAPAGEYNVSFFDDNYVSESFNRSVSVPEYITVYPYTVYHNFALTDKNITGTRVITFLTDNDCSGVYDDLIGNLSMSVYSLGSSIYNLIDGVNGYMGEDVVNASFNETTSKLTITLKKGTYSFAAGKTGYYDAAYQDTAILISGLNNQVYGETQYLTHLLENASCFFPVNYTINTTTYSDSVRVPLGDVRIDFYDYITGAYQSTNYTSSAGILEVKNASRMIDVRGSKTGYNKDSSRREIADNEVVNLILRTDVPVRRVQGTIYQCGTDARTRLKGVDVRLTSSAGDLFSSASSNEYGVFLFENVPEGSYVLRYSLYGYGSKNKTVNLAGFNWIDDSTLCLTVDTSFCQYEVEVLGVNDTILTGIDVSAYRGDTNALFLVQTIPGTGYALFTLPQVLGTQNNDLGYRFKVSVPGYSDPDSEKTYTCLMSGITKRLTPNADDDDLNYTEAEMWGWFERNIWSIFLLIFITFCVFLLVSMGRGIITGIKGR
jgi:hypothetical protein